MGCFCKTNLDAVLGQLGNLPLSLLASIFPGPISINHMANISATLGAQATATADLSLMAQLAASANISANLSASAVARLEAMAAIKQQLGINLLGPSASVSASLSLAIQSANLHLPSFSQMLAQLMAPIIEVLNEIAAALGAMLSINSQLGINLMASASASLNLQAAVSARIAAMAALNAQASLGLDASASAMANLSLQARLVAAANILGFNLGLPGVAASLNAALSVAANLQLPSFDFGIGMMGNLSALLGQLAAILAALGINLLAPGGANLLLSAQASIQAAISAMASLDLNASVAASLSARAQAQLTANASLSASLQAAASLDLSGFALGFVPFFPSLNVMANLTAQLSATLPILALSPCLICPFGK